jgi:amino acid permease
VSIGTSYAQAGWLPTTSLLLLCAFLSILSSGFLCETIRSAPGNHKFTRRIEVNLLLHDRFFLVTLLGIFGFISARFWCFTFEQITDAMKLARVPRPFFLLCFASFVLLFMANNTAAIVEVF